MNRIFCPLQTRLYAIPRQQLMVCPEHVCGILKLNIYLAACMLQINKDAISVSDIRGAWMQSALNRYCKVKIVSLLLDYLLLDFLLFNRKNEDLESKSMEFKMSVADCIVVKPDILLVVHFGIVCNSLNQRKNSLKKMSNIPKKYPLKVKKKSRSVLQWRKSLH